MVSNDGIMSEFYYTGTSKIINLSIEIGKKLGIVDSTYLRKPKTKLRKTNRIKSIQSSLWIEGNSLTIDQVTDIFENKRVIGPEKDIIEVKNAINVYENLRQFKAFETKSFLKGHRLLMKGLIENPGEYRRQGVGVFKGSQLAHMAPPVWNVDNLMNKLFKYLSQSTDSIIIKSCVCHYELEFIHPFTDGNGRMGRLWQTVILMLENPIFEYLPIELEIKENQKEYYEALSKSDKSGESTIFIEYMLDIINNSLKKVINQQRGNLNDLERLIYFREQYTELEFTRKDYLDVFKDISAATATRDMKKGISEGFWQKIGDNRTTKYKIVKNQT